MPKSLIVPTLALFCTLAAAAHAAPKNSLTLEPVGLYWNIGNVELEHLFERRSAWAFRANYSNYHSADWIAPGLGGGASFRYFPLPRLRAPRGLWFGPAADVLVTNVEHRNRIATGVLTGLGAEIGYKWLFGRKVAFVVSPFAKAQYWFGDIAVDRDPYPAFHGLHTYLGVSIGFAF